VVFKDISPETAPTPLLRVLDVVLGNTVDHSVEADNNAISAPDMATLPVTAPKAVLVDMEETKEAMEVDMVPVKTAHDRPATHVAVWDTCPVIVHKVKSATTVVKLVTCPATVVKSLARSVLATSASSQVTNRLNAPTKFSK